MKPIRHFNKFQTKCFEILKISILVKFGML